MNHSNALPRFAEDFLEDCEIAKAKARKIWKERKTFVKR